MNNKKSLIIRIADVWLEDDKHLLSWRSDPNLLKMWYLLFTTIILSFSVLVIVMITPIATYMRSSKEATLVFRFMLLAFSLCIIAITVGFSSRYYVYTIVKAHAVDIVNIGFFYILACCGFFMAYFYIYLLWPGSFIVKQPTIIVSPLAQEINLESAKLRLDFFLFSALQSVNGSYFRVQINSTLISVLAYIQSLYTMSLVVLFISAFVNQKTNQALTKNEKTKPDQDHGH